MVAKKLDIMKDIIHTNISGHDGSTINHTMQNTKETTCNNKLLLCMSARISSLDLTSLSVFPNLCIPNYKITTLGNNMPLF